MNLVVSIKEKYGNNLLLINAIKCIIFALIMCLCVMGTHAFYAAYIDHVHGKPDFVRNSMFYFSFLEKFLLAVSYLLLGRKIAIKNTKLRALTYALLVLGSNNFPQIMGLVGADGPIAELAFGMSTIICDSLCIIIAGVLLGILFKDMPEVKIRKVNKKSYIKTIITSAIGFPLMVIVIDQLMFWFYRPFSSAGAIGVSEGKLMVFFISFYSCFILSGAFFAVFYRMTEYNEENENAWIRYATIYILLLWSPVVLVMVVFGTAVIPTIAYTMIFAICIVINTWINSKLLNE